MSGIEKVGIATAQAIPEHRKSVYEYYRLTFDEAGCPMKQTDSGMVFHPILAAYLISDFTREFDRTGDRSFLVQAEAIAIHALKRAERLGDALIFIYNPDIGLSNVPKKFYSALTQARYLKAICELSDYFPGAYQEEIRQLFSSLTIPIEESGVLIKKGYGWIVEEYPFKPPFYTLNGWLSVLLMVTQCGERLKSLGIQYSEFLENNLDAVEYLLPFFDAPFCLNSRYQLTGYSRIKIVFDRAVVHECLGFEVEIPGEGRFDGVLANKNKSRWQNYLERNEPKLLQFNVLLSIISKPTPNVFRMQLKVDASCKAKLFLAQGEYRPNVTAMPTESWKEIADLVIDPDGITYIECPLPFDGNDLFAYPTNFKKKIGVEMFNVYHFIHVLNLAELYHYSKRITLKHTAEKWLGYYKKWDSLPYLQGQNYSLLPHRNVTAFAAGLRRLLD